MRYRLGSLDIDSVITRTSLLRRMRALAIARLQQDAAGLFPPDGRAQDLLTALSNDDPDREWVEVAADVLHELRDAGHRLVLVDCEHTVGPTGHCSMLLYDRSAGDHVRSGDVVYAGVAIARTAATGLCVVPRVFRQVCSNGALIETGDFDVQHVQTYQIDRLVRAALDPESFENTLQDLRLAARTPLHDPARAALRLRLETPLRSLLAEWVKQSDPTVYGLLNAATATAHVEPDTIARLARERDAGRILRALCAHADAESWFAESPAASRVDAT